MSTNKQYDYLIYILRSAPFTIAHETVLQTALSQAKYVILLIGSSNRARTIRNPFNFYERANMIRANIAHSFPEDDGRIHIRPLNDYFYNQDAWIKEVQKTVTNVISGVETGFGQDIQTRTESQMKIGIIGFVKDKTTGYMDLFPQWTKVPHDVVLSVGDKQPINATDIRQVWFEHGDKVFQNTYVTYITQSILDEFTNTSEYQLLVEEYNCIKKYKLDWSGAKHAPYFVTCDAVVTQSGHILLVTRGSSPGKGLLALPGGFLEQDEFLECGVLRELKEETKIDVPVKVLRGNIKQSHTFDHPLRSLRGRTITYASHIDLPAGELPKVKGSDDAIHAKWVPFNEIRSEELFEDHFDIITYFINIT